MLIADTDIDNKIYNKLMRMGFETVEQIVRYSADDLQNVRGFGPSSVALIEEFLRGHGRKLAKTPAASRGLPPIEPLEPLRTVMSDVVFNGDKLSALRKDRGLSQAALADEINLASQDVIRRWEHGEAQPTATNLIRLCIVLKCPVMAFASD